MYTVAVLSDIHGNAAAPRAVIGDLRARVYDPLVVAGDPVYGGPRQAEAVAPVRELRADVICGHADRHLVEQDEPWVRAALGGDGTGYLAAPPFSCLVTPAGGASPGDDLLAVHATPADVEGILTVAPNPFGVLTATPEARARELLGDAQATLILSGNVHHFSEGWAAGRRLASVGSVGLPFDGDPRAAYALAGWDEGAWRIGGARAAPRSGAPFAETTARRLESSRR